MQLPKLSSHQRAIPFLTITSLALCLALPSCDSDDETSQQSVTPTGGGGSNAGGSGGSGGQGGSAAGHGGEGGSGGQGGENLCQDSAAGVFPPQAQELSYQPDEGTGSIKDYNWNPIEGYEGSYLIGEEPMWEAVRFDLTAPATVYGARVMWGQIPDGEERSVSLGAYADFGSNGFDFDQWEPLWTGNRCLDSEQDLYTWVDYVFDQPIEVEIPGLFYIASSFEPPAGQAVAFHPDALECDTYASCHSAINLKEGEPNSYYNGLSLTFPYSYSIRLMVEVHDTIPPESKWFQIDDTFSASSQVAWGDYDNDGFDDLVTNGPTLYHNNGDGTFTDVTAAALLDQLATPTAGAIWGDYNNDGHLDLFGMGNNNTLPDRLLHNNGDGTFTDVTVESLIDDTQDQVDCNGDGQPERSPTPAAAWVDIDADGFLDLYMASYECNDPYEFYMDRFFHNEGDGTFDEWFISFGFTAYQLAGRGVSPIDVDRDHDVDIFVSNYRLNRNLMYENDNGTEVHNRASAWNLAGTSSQGYYGHTIGSAWIDLENDGDWDLIQANLAHPRYYHFSDRTMVMRNDGNQLFEDIAQQAGIHYRETHSNPTVQDFDNDGDWDLFLTCVYEGRFSELYLNDGTGSFTQVNYPSGAIIHNGWGSAAADFDNDGDVDLVAYDLMVNQSAAAGNHWLQVRSFGGVTANWAGIGAIVEIDVAGETLMSHVSGGSGTGCQDSAMLSFGLGSASEVNEIRVFYPGGATATVNGPIAADQRVWIYEDGTITYGWTP